MREAEVDGAEHKTRAIYCLNRCFDAVVDPSPLSVRIHPSYFARCHVKFMAFSRYTRTRFLSNTCDVSLSSLTCVKFQMKFGLLLLDVVNSDFR